MRCSGAATVPPPTVLRLPSEHPSHHGANDFIGNRRPVRLARSDVGGRNKRPIDKAPRLRGFPLGGRYWARTSDPQLVELVLSQLS